MVAGFLEKRTHGLPVIRANHGFERLFQKIILKEVAANVLSRKSWAVKSLQAVECFLIHNIPCVSVHLAEENGTAART